MVRRLDNSQLNRIIGMLQAGMSQRRCANIFGVNQSIISRTWARFLVNNSVNRTRGGGRRRTTSARTDRLIRLSVRRHPHENATQLRNNLIRNENIALSVSTIRRRLHETNFRARRPARHPPLTREHRRNRLQWARDHANWDHIQWRKCVFTDESRFALHPDDNRVRVWREVGQRYDERFMLERYPFGGGSVTAWAAICTGQRSDLILFVNETVNAERYLEILRQNIPIFVNIIGNDLVYVDDNARPHRARIVNEFFNHEGINRMNWPACSPDCNPIEHVWDALKRRISNRQVPPQNIEELIVALREEWVQIPADQINNVVNSMPRRCNAVIRARGGPTSY